MTKFFSLAAVALALTAGAASAENTFSLDRARSTASSVALNNVQADQAGSVEVWGLNEQGKVDRFLGQAALREGANGDLDVELNQPHNARQLQILISNGNRSVAVLEVREPLTN